MQIERKAWKLLQETNPSSRFICLDESGAKTNMTRLYGRAKSAYRCIGKNPHGHWKTVTMLSSLWSTGKTESLVFDGATNKEIFELYIEKNLLPHLKAGDIVVMDNLASHKTQKVQELIASKEAKAMYLPPYSPDLNPIEQMWSKIKSILRKVEANTFDELTNAIGTALDLISQNDAKGWFKNSGYKV